MEKKLQMRVPDAVADYVSGIAKEKGISVSAVAREIFMRGLEDDALKQQEYVLETLCLLRRLVSVTDFDLLEKSREDMNLILSNERGV